MIKNTLMILLNIQEKIWLKQLDCLIFNYDSTYVSKAQRKENLLTIEEKLRNLIKFRWSLRSK